MTRDASAPLDFLTERDDQTGSWERSDPLHAVIRPHNGDTFDVKLPDGDYHDVRLHRENGAWFGTCDCKGYQYGDDGERMATRDLLIAATARSTGAELIVSDADFETQLLTDRMAVTNLHPDT